MKPISKDDYLITHSNCADGTGCALVFALFGGDVEKIIYSSPVHSKVDALAIANRKVHGGRLFLADISISEETAEKLAHRDDVFVFDHHKSAIGLSKYDWCEIDKENNRCGSLMFLEYALKHGKVINLKKLAGLKLLIAHIDDRDRWQNKLMPRTQYLYDLFNIIGQAAFFERCRTMDTPWLINEAEQFLIDSEEAKKHDYIENLQVAIKEVNGFKIGFCICEPKYTSEGGHHLVDKHNLDACALVNTHAVSLRAPENSKLDMAEIAKKYDGGGHRCAAGFPIKSLLGKSILENIMEYFTLDDQCDSNCG